jgi:hypothetical protein
MWWRFIHEAPPDAAAPTPARPVETDPVADRNEAAERAAYNSYLAELAARDKPKQWR